MVKQLKAAPEDSVRCLAYSQEASLPNNNNNLPDSVALVKLLSRSPHSNNRQDLEVVKVEVFLVSRPSPHKDSAKQVHHLKVLVPAPEAACLALLAALVALAKLNNLRRPPVYSVVVSQYNNPRTLLECNQILARSAANNKHRVRAYLVPNQQALARLLPLDRHRLLASNSNLVLDSSARVQANHNSAARAAHLEAVAVSSTRINSNLFNQLWARDYLVSSQNQWQVLH